MFKDEKIVSIEKRISFLQEENNKKPLSLGEILATLSDKSKPLFLILLSLPFCQPIQIPGLSIPFGLVIMLIGLRTAIGKSIWLPKKLSSKTIPNHILEKIIVAAFKVIKKIQPWVHQRIDWFCHSPTTQFINGFFIFILGTLLALPLPIPLSNMVTAWSICFISFGILEDDGLLILIGYLASILTIAFFIIAGLALKHAHAQFYLENM